MHFRNLTFAGALAVVLSLVQGQVIAQSVNAKPTKPATKTWTALRTVDGQPDLEGVWANNNATPLERPKELAGRAFLTEQEVAALKKKANELFSGEADAAFGDTVFLSVLANVQGEGLLASQCPLQPSRAGEENRCPFAWAPTVL